MEIKVNGKAQSLVAERVPLPELLAELGVDPEQPGIAIAVNYEVIPRSEWSEAFVKAGDEVELITARQGG